jgi:hypothetical protein
MTDTAEAVIADMFRLMGETFASMGRGFLAEQLAAAADTLAPRFPDTTSASQTPAAALEAA